MEYSEAVQWIRSTTPHFVMQQASSAASDNSPGRVAALVCTQVSVTLAAIASFASRLYIFSLITPTKTVKTENGPISRGSKPFVDQRS